MAISNNNASSPITLDALHKEMKHWRENKHDYVGHRIPDHLWKMFFEFEQAGNSGAELRRMFSLNSAQYKKKYEELCHHALPAQKKEINEPDEPDQLHEPIEFCEVTVEPPSTLIPPLTQTVSDVKQSLKQLKSTRDTPEDYLDATTIVVECISPDGHRLKIHTTTQSLNVVMKTFFQQRQAAACS